jgi:hypothetical protein
MILYGNFSIDRHRECRSSKDEGGGEVESAHVQLSSRNDLCRVLFEFCGSVLRVDEK